MLSWIEKHILDPVGRMAEIALGDPNFFVGTAAFLVTILFPILAQRRKKIFFDVICRLVLFDEVLGSLVPRREDPEVSKKKADNEHNRLTLFVIDVQNSTSGFFGGFGGADIGTEQYERNISFNFGENTCILDATVLDKRPPDIEADLDANTFQENELILAPVVLNQGDWIRLGVVVQTRAHIDKGSHPDIAANGRILGIRKIQEKRNPAPLALLAIGLGEAPLLLLGLAVFLWELVSRRDFPEISNTVGLFVAAWLATFLLFGTFLGLIAIRRYIRKWWVARRFSDLTPETWVPIAIMIAVPIALFVTVWYLLFANIIEPVFSLRVVLAGGIVYLVLLLVLLVGVRFVQRTTVSSRRKQLREKLQRTARSSEKP